MAFVAAMAQSESLGALSAGGFTCPQYRETVDVPFRISRANLL